ncbi:MAG: molybdenum cofactor biosysynthesis protein, partial [Pseudolysinimonas sp.]|uniref:molybdenum cofactor biosysynthesis protein n=1 Tax=Pseudolysinimonas sp. TaxID=2680009 RepID=UPI003C744A2C
MEQIAVEIVQLLASPVHRFEGRPADGPAPAPEGELRDDLELRAGLGIVGDRHFNQRAHRASSVTIQAAEALEAVATELGIPHPTLLQTRRNILLRGVDVDALARTTFSLDSGDGEIRFGDPRSANPCAWMDVAVAPGAHRAFRRRGGLRTGPLDDGVLRLGPAVLRIPSVV